MESTAYIALSRQSVLREKMAVVAQNLANITTPGFKAEDMLFVEYLDESSPSGAVSFVQSISLIRDFAPGPLSATGNALDLAIKGEGYFTVETPEGPRFTRNGSFSLNGDGEVVNSEGLALLDDANAPLVIPANSGSITVARDGTISTERGRVGQITLVRFEDERRLKKIGGGLFDAGGEIALPLENGEVHQGMIEGSNVKGVVEMTRMIDTVRSYQSASRLIDEEHRRIRDAINRLVATGQA